MIVLIIVALIYICLPWYVQMAIWIINVFMPDTIPVLDELAMFVPMVVKIKRIIQLSEFLRKYGIILAVLLGIGLIVLIICLLV